MNEIKRLLVFALGMCFLLMVFSLPIPARGQEQSDIAAEAAARENDGEDGLAVEMKDKISFKTMRGGEVKIYLLCDDSVIVSRLEPATPEETEALNREKFSDLIALYQTTTGKSEVPADVARLNGMFLAGKERVLSTLPVDRNGGLVAHPAQDALAGDVDGYYTVGETQHLLWHSDLSNPQTFIGECCQYGENDNYHYCWTNRTGNGRYVNWVSSMTTSCYVYRGAVNHKIKHREHSWSDWHDHANQVVNAGWWSYLNWYTFDGKLYLKGEVWNGDGDGYHFSIYGFH